MASGAVTAGLLRFFVAQAGLRRLVAGGLLVFGMVDLTLPTASRDPRGSQRAYDHSLRLPRQQRACRLRRPDQHGNANSNLYPRPVIKQGMPLVFTLTVKPEKRPRFYPPMWMAKEQGRGSPLDI